jgi:PAS domain S-box-containing protein
MERFDLLQNNFEALSTELRIIGNQLKKENKEFFTAIVENSPNSMSIVQNGKFVYVNSSGISLLKCKSSGDIIGQSYLEFVHQDDHNTVAELLRKGRNIPGSSAQLKCLRFDKSVFDAEINVVPFVYNKMPAALLVCRDISIELQHKFELQREEQFRTDILNAFEEVIAFYSPDHSIIWLNEAGKKHLGISEESYVGKLCHKLWFSSDHPCGDCPITNHKRYEISERIVPMKNNSIWLVKHTPMFDKHKHLTGYIEFRTNITEKEHIKTELEKSHERQIRAEMENSFGHFEFDLSSGETYWSHGACNLFGLAPETSQKFSEDEFLELIHPEDIKEIKHHLSLAYTGKRKFDIIFRIADLNRNRKTIRGIGETKTDPVTNRRLFFGVIQDITHITNLEKQVFDEREKYKLLAEHVPFGLVLTLNHEPVYINKTLRTWLKLDSVSALKEVELSALFHPNDMDRVLKLLVKLRNNNIRLPTVENLRIIETDGTTRYIRFNIQHNSINNQLYLQTVITDITGEVVHERKKKQAAANALYMNQKNTILNEIENDLSTILGSKKYTKSQSDFDKIFTTIKHYRQLDKDWKMLIANFEEVYPGFFMRLKKMYPLLSPNDIKHCACIKMNFDTKEIARFFHIQPTSVQINRVRLKKKMQLSNSSDLRDYILNF